MRLRYFGIPTMWYSVRYTVWTDNLFFIATVYQNIGGGIHPRLKAGNSAARGLETEAKLERCFSFLIHYTTLRK